MKRIVCATRGGAASRRVQEQAIALARQHSAKLTFLFVADTSSCGRVSEELTEILEDELKRMGRSLLHIAYVRAHEQGVEAEMLIRCGPVRQTILDVVRETEADALFVGAPRPATSTPEFGEEGMRDFAAEVKQTTGAEVFII